MLYTIVLSTWLTNCNYLLVEYTLSKNLTTTPRKEYEKQLTAFLSTNLDDLFNKINVFL